MFTSERPHYSLALFPSFIMCPFSKKIEFALKKEHSVKSPEYANILYANIL